MSSNIYEDASLTMNVKYCKRATEDDEQRVETMVDIYESVDSFTDRHVSPPRGAAHAQHHPPAGRRNPFRTAALVLAPLCLILGVGVIVVSTLYVIITLANSQLRISHEELQTRFKNMSQTYCQSQETGTQTQGENAEWKIFRCSCYYKSTEMKNWTESRKDCESKGADLVVISSRDEQDFVRKLNKAGDAWLGLQPVKHAQRGTGTGTETTWKWKWVDGSSLPYLAWRIGVTVNPMEDRSRAYIDLNGTWGQTNNGSKQWICEKRIYVD